MPPGGRRALFAVGAVVLTMAVAAPTASALETITPNSHDFGAVDNGLTGPPFAFTLSTSCTDDPANMGYQCFAGGDPPFPTEIRVQGNFTQTNNCPAMMSRASTVAATCTINVAFAPRQSGPHTGFLSAGVGGTAPFATLTGTGIARFPPAVPGGPGPVKRKCKKKKGKKGAAAAKRCRKKRK
jgi:hypothetical protein